MPSPRRKPQQRAKYRALQARLRLWREAAGLTQRALAAKLGHPHPFCHKVETGQRRIDPAEWADWVIACGVDPKEAFGGLFRS